MSFPHINRLQENPWIGLYGEFHRVKKDAPNPQTADAFVRAMDFNNLYQRSSGAKSKHQRMFGGREVVGLRWFQRVLQRNEANTGFNIKRINYEIIECTPIFNAEVGVSCGASGFVVAYQVVQDYSKWDEQTDLFTNGSEKLAGNNIGNASSAQHYYCKTVLYGDLTYDTNMSLSIPNIVAPNPEAVLNTADAPYHQSLEGPTWRLRPRGYINLKEDSRLQQLSNGDELRQCLLQSFSPIETLKYNHTIQIKMATRKVPGRGGGYPNGIPIFKEYFLKEEDRSHCVNKEYHVGIRFIIDYHNVCKQLYDDEMEHFGMNNGVYNQEDEQWLQELYSRKNQTLEEDEENMFYFKMLSMPVFHKPT